ncbi:putative 3-phosphoinositide-dependent protein kinase 2 [Coffea eugenioides]|uniref:putative 3-phosphoinositide-dependent protein kinase 2 n=1 Tax=Coffea eugenioides TaxID=49369 RepID=UPI000F60DB7D|nr:putative 3-phosphoinositide-dependent protein kinase 2 [Coffea eugenioides]
MNALIDVASALEHLHRSYSIPVIHCDLKPNNVLLNEDMVACVTNFGVPNILSILDQVVDANLLKPGYQHFAEKLEGITSIVRIAVACTEDSPRDRMNAIDVLASHDKSKYWSRDPRYAMDFLIHHVVEKFV